MASTLGESNSLRYRGYVYDSETGFYYLQSRYYNPELGRFINADIYTSTGQGLLGNNMFAYCLNNPVIYGDPDGKDAILLYDDSEYCHIGALIQDETGQWWHFYWGAQLGWRRILSKIGISVAPLVAFDLYNGDLNLDAINAGTRYGGVYCEMLYLEGDFSESARIALDAPNTTAKYNAISNNCSQVTLRVLAQSETKYQNVLLEASEKILPNNAFSTCKRGVISLIISEISSRIKKRAFYDIFD